MLPLNEPIKMILEAILFAAEKPISASEIHKWLPDQSLSEIKKGLKEVAGAAHFSHLFMTSSIHLA